MAAISHFLATSLTSPQLSRQQIEGLLLDLVRDGHALLPAVIFVGQAKNQCRGEALDLAVKQKTLVHASEHIIPNAPAEMLFEAVDILEHPEYAGTTLWRVVSQEQELRDALQHLPLRVQDCCICFPVLSQQLSEEWDQGATFSALTTPFFLDFMHPFDTTALPLLDERVTDFFTLTSYTLGGFQDVQQHALFPLLQRAFGPELLMRQTADVEF